MPRYANIIPVLRTPFGVDGFDYLIPEHLTEIQVGSLVIIPFRRSTLVGIVKQISSQSRFAGKAKPVSRLYFPFPFPQSVLDLLAWTAKRTFCSEPTVLAAWLRQLPKRPIMQTEKTTPLSKKTEGILQANWEHQPSALLLKRAQELRRRGKRVLIVVPWITRIHAYQSHLPHASILHSELSTGAAFQAWTSFITQPNACLLTTRLGTWLAPWADVVLLDEPENDDHKQDELAPRYDARLLLVWCSKHAAISVESYGLTPALHVETPAPALLTDLRVHPRRPGGFSNIPCIQADSLESLCEHEGPRIIYHPIRGMAARLVCRDCGWRAPCPFCTFELSAEIETARCHQCQKTSPLPTACAICHGLDLGKSTPGIEKLKIAWGKHEAKTAVEWRTLSNQDVDTPIPKNALVLVTDATLLGGAVDDARRRERTCVAFRRLADRVWDAQGKLIIQCPEMIDLITHHPITPPIWQEWLTPEGFDAFRQHERQDRRLFHYPPANRLVKCLIDGEEQVAKEWGEKAKKALPQAVSMRGPYMVAFRPSSRSKRFVWHIILPPETSEESLLAALTPLASSAIIDLDPIAFFK